ncbi:MAG: TetR/AcrR family transcriptional regulator, partial [Wenzhouxiangella sp.]|nr:TetR/AcrR family transcriptional regulator [Wenzhouxiangella sp.]
MRKSGEQRREEIVQAVIKLAAESNSGQISAQAIADRVGIAQPTVFRHFKNRDGILEAVAQWIARNLLGTVKSVATGTGPADGRLRLLLARQLSFVASHPGLPRLLFSERLHEENARLKQAVRTIMDDYTTILSGLLREGIVDGTFRSDLEVEQTARLILAMIQGLVMRWSIHDFEFDLP